MFKIPLITLLLLFQIKAAAGATPVQDLSIIRDQVKSFLYQFPELRDNNNTSIKVNHIDRRLKLTACQKLGFELATGSHLSGKVSVKVVCSTPKPWSFYVTTHISRFEQVYIANATLYRGKIITPHDVFKTRKDLSKLPFGYITSADLIVGKQVKRSIQAGRVLLPSQLSNPLIVKRGDEISLHNKSAGFAISMKGTAMADGAVGDRIRVKNNSSRRIVEGVISQAGIVEIGK